MLTENDRFETKQKLLIHCQKFIDDRINAIESAMAAAQDSANDETKSSAGDKYETGRAMMQLDIEQNGRQLAEATKQKTILHQINPAMVSAVAKFGSVVHTDNGNFFIAISVGQVQVEQETFMIVSAQSPAGSKLIGRQAGDTISFANKRYAIISVS